MARTQHLPLYSLAYNFTRKAYRIKLKLPITMKHDLGQQFFESTIKILKYIVIANNDQEKTVYISNLLIETEVEWVLLRLLFDLRGISNGEFKVLSEQSEYLRQRRRYSDF